MNTEQLQNALEWLGGTEHDLISLGHDVWMRFSGDYGDPDDKRTGLVYIHPANTPTGYCAGHIRWVPFFTDPENQKKEALWRLVSMEPLHVEPSLLCTACGHHGFIRNGKWVTV